jgi:hypothetical protein
VAKVHLAALGRREGERDKGVGEAAIRLSLCSQFTDQLAHCRFRHRDLLLPQLDPHPVRRPLLLGRPPLQLHVLLKPGVEVRHHHIPYWRRVGPRASVAAL